MAESIDAVSVYYRTALKARLQDPNESLQSVPQLESSLPACPCPKTITDISKLICNVCLIKMIEIRLEAMSGFQRTEFNRREQIYRDQLSISDGAVKDLRREGRIREVKINNLTSECKFLRKSNDILHDAIKNSNSILRNNGLANLESPFEQPWKVSDTAKAALASEEFEDTAPKKTKSNDPAPTSIEKIVEEAATNTFTAKVNEAEQAIKNAIETAKAEFTQQLTDAKNEIDTKIAEIKNDVGKIPDELKGHTEEEMLRITEYTTGQFRELLNYPELASIQINFRTRSVACDVDFFHQRLLIYHALVRDGTINKHDTNSSNAKYVNYRSKNTGRTFGNIIELNNSFSVDVNPYIAKNRNGSGSGNDADDSNPPSNDADNDNNEDVLNESLEEIDDDQADHARDEQAQDELDVSFLENMNMDVIVGPKVEHDDPLTSGISDSDSDDEAEDVNASSDEAETDVEIAGSWTVQGLIDIIKREVPNANPEDLKCHTFQREIKRMIVRFNESKKDLDRRQADLEFELNVLKEVAEQMAFEDQDSNGGWL